MSREIGGVIVDFTCGQGESVLVSLPDEDFGKAEGQDFDSLRPLISIMMAGVSGGINSGESGVEAAVRETLEEWGLIIDSSRLKPLSGRLDPVFQLRDSRLVSIIPHPYTCELSEREIDYLFGSMKPVGRSVVVASSAELLNGVLRPSTRRLLLARQ